MILRSTKLFNFYENRPSFEQGCDMKAIQQQTEDKHHRHEASLLKNNYLIPMTLKRRWNYSNRDTSTVMTAHRLLSSAMCSIDDIDWPVHFSLIFAVFLCLRRLSSTVPFSVIFSCILWRQTWLSRDDLRCLTFDSRSFWRPARLLIYALCMICQISSCSIYFHKPGFVSPDPSSWRA